MVEYIFIVDDPAIPKSLRIHYATKNIWRMVTVEIKISSRVCSFNVEIGYKKAFKAKCEFDIKKMNSTARFCCYLPVIWFD